MVINITEEFIEELVTVLKYLIVSLAILIQDLVKFFADFLQSDINHMITSVTDIRSPFYTWLFLWIFIKIYRTLNNI